MARDVRSFSAFTQGGAVKLALFYKSLGKKVLSNPAYSADTTLWHFDVLWSE